MPTFIDESGGDTSHHRDAQLYYRLAAVWVPADQADALRAALDAVRARSRLPESYEFKYHKTHLRPDRRAAFYSAAMGHGIRFAVACIDKRPGGWHGKDRGEFFRTAACHLAMTLHPVYLAAEAESGKVLREPITVDNNDDGLFLDSIREAFRALESGIKPGVSLAQKPKFAESDRAVLLQVADMICGAVGEKLDGDPTSYNLIKRAGVGEDCGYGQGVGYWG